MRKSGDDNSSVAQFLHGITLRDNNDVSETDDSDIETLLQHVLDARDERLSGFGLTEESMLEQHSREFLLGRGNENAFVLADTLEEEGYDPILVWGTYQPDQQYPSLSRDKAENLGLVHFWVELEDSGGEPIVCEVATKATLDGQHMAGDPLVTRGRPDEYIVPDNCRFQFSRADIEPGDFDGIEGYRHLVEQGLLLTDSESNGR